MNEIFTSATFYLIRKDSNVKFLVSSQSVLSPGASESVYLLYMFVYYNVSVFLKLWLRLHHSLGRGSNARGYKCSVEKIPTQEQMGDAVVTVKSLKMMGFSGMDMCARIARFSKVCKYMQYFAVSVPTSVDASACLMISTC